MPNKLSTPTPHLKSLKKTLVKSIKDYKQEHALSDWKWCIDYSDAVGQKDKEMVPELFKSRSEARRWNSKNYPRGVVRNVKINIIMGNKTEKKYPKYDLKIVNRFCMNCSKECKQVVQKTHFGHVQKCATCHSVFYSDLPFEKMK